jgi:hypothetical protein
VRIKFSLLERLLIRIHKSPSFTGTGTFRLKVKQMGWGEGEKHTKEEE